MNPIDSFNEEMALFRQRAAALHEALARHKPDISLRFAEDLLEIEDHRNAFKPLGSTPTISLTELFSPTSAERVEEQHQEWNASHSPTNGMQEHPWPEAEKERRVHEVQHDLISRGLQPVSPTAALYMAQARAYNEKHRLVWLRDTPAYTPTGNTVDGLTFEQRLNRGLETGRPLAALLPRNVRLTIVRGTGGYEYTLSYVERNESWAEGSILAWTATTKEEHKTIVDCLARLKEQGALQNNMYTELVLESEEDRDTRQLLIDARAAAQALLNPVGIHAWGEGLYDVILGYAEKTDLLTSEEVEAVVAAANAVPGLLKYIDRLHADLRHLRSIHTDLYGKDLDISTDYEKTRWGL